MNRYISEEINRKEKKIKLSVSSLLQKSLWGDIVEDIACELLSLKICCGLIALPFQNTARLKSAILY